MNLLVTIFGEKSVVDYEMGVGRKAGERCWGYDEYIVLYYSCCFILLRDCVVIG